MRIGDVIDLEKYNPLGSMKLRPKRLARVIALYPRFVLCEALNGGYKECVGIARGGWAA